VIDVDSGAELDDRIPNTRASSIAWLPDNSGFWYCRYPEGDVYNRHVFFHRLGTDADDDPLVFDALPNPQAWPEVTASDDGRHLLVSVMVGWTRVDAHLLDTASGAWRDVVTGVEALSTFFFHGDALYAVTYRDAPNGRVVVAALDAPHDWRTVVAERDAVLASGASFGDALILVCSDEAVDRVEMWSTDGVLQRSLDELGLVSVQSLDADDGVAFIAVSSFDAPPAMYRFGDGQLLHWSARIDSSLMPAMTVQHLTYPSLDGTEIGLFLMHRADIEPGPGVPLLLTGYGGFAIAEKPSWLVRAAAW
jgi:prolyl oligopeptidase